jgi:hypothetical protein
MARPTTDTRPRMLLWASALFVCVALAACSPSKSSSSGGSSNSSGSSTSSPSLTLSLARSGTTAPYPVIVTATVLSPSGSPLAGQAVQITATGGAVGTVTDNRDGTYTATVTPTGGVTSEELPITGQATVAGTVLSSTHTALILPGVDAAWGQPEAVRGTVNTPAYEDGASVSPDGQWLIVTDYSPVDVFECAVVNTVYSSLPCQTVLGPYTAPERPNLPGANRILSSTHILNYCPTLCFTADATGNTDPTNELTTVALPPIGSFMFQRQADGSFSNAAFIGIEADGCSIPVWYSFTSAPVAQMAQMMFAWQQPYPSANFNLFTSTVTLGTTTTLMTCSCQSSAQVFSPPLPGNQLTFSMPGQNTANAHLAGGFLWVDDENGTAPKPLHWATASGTFPSVTFSPTTTSTSDVIQVGSYTSLSLTQPYFDTATTTLYYAANNALIDATPMTGATPGPGSWGTETAILQADYGNATTVGAIYAIGQPSIARPAGGTVELYFIYVMTTATGTNFNVGVVPQL